MSDTPQYHHGPIKLRQTAIVNQSTANTEYEFLKNDVSSLRITFRHPAYPSDDDILFTLSAFDHAEGGLHHGFAHSVCALVADNRDDGFLSLSREVDSPKISAGVDDVLKAGCDYYYFVPHPVNIPEHDRATPFRWPVVTNFKDFRMPDRLPQLWTRTIPNTNGSLYSQPLPVGAASQSNYTLAVRMRDISCRVTGHQTGTEVAHLCPESEREWFIANNMQQYKTNLNSDSAHLLKDPANMLLIRSDLHKPFDDRWFTFFPKGHDASSSMVAHMLQQTPDLGQIYHNIRLHALPYCSPEFLFARFAWSIFPALGTTFLSRRVSRYVVVVDEHTGERDAKEIFNPQMLQERASTSRSRSPKKRPRSTELGEMIESSSAKMHPQSPGNLDGELGDYKKRQKKESPCDPSPYKSETKRVKYDASPSSTSTFDDNRSNFSTDVLTLASSQDVPESESLNECDIKKKAAQGFIWYSGAEKLESMKQQALLDQRPPEFLPATSAAHNISGAQEVSQGQKRDVKDDLEDMGFEIVDDDWPNRLEETDSLVNF